jgi:acetoacetate decarboxylase
MRLMPKTEKDPKMREKENLELAVVPEPLDQREPLVKYEFIRLCRRSIS